MAFEATDLYLLGIFLWGLGKAHSVGWLMRWAGGSGCSSLGGVFCSGSLLTSFLFFSWYSWMASLMLWLLLESEALRTRAVLDSLSPLPRGGASRGPGSGVCGEGARGPFPCCCSPPPYKIKKNQFNLIKHGRSTQNLVMQMTPPGGR